MCLAIYKPKGIRIAKRYLKHGFQNNGDGAGFAICVDNQVEIFKGFWTFADFMRAYEPHADKSAIIHFRVATHGDKTSQNCHPFDLFAGKYAVIHNGILNIATNHQKDMSDTWHFAELVLAPMLTRFTFDHPALKYLIETSIGSYNKMVILRGDGAHVIYNENHGGWHKGAWYSNDSFKHGKTYMAACEAIETAWEKVTDKFPDFEGRSERGEITDAEYEAACEAADDPEYARACRLLERENKGENLTLAETALLAKVFERVDDDDCDILENAPSVEPEKMTEENACALGKM